MNWLFGVLLAGYVYAYYWASRLLEDIFK